jgi:arylsulfatase A-like enzyme
VLWLALAGAACGGGTQRPRPVLVIVCDSLAAGHVSSYGSERPTTPSFDRFAARGARFEQASAPSSWTLPSVASLFTSLEQEDHRLTHLDGRLREDAATLAELFRGAGHRTVAVVQTPVLGSRTGLGRGFERYRVLDFSLASFDQALGIAEEELAGTGERPIFVYLHLTPPHMPYQPPEPFRGRFREGLAPASAVTGSIADCRRVHRERLAPEHPDVRALAALYDEHVAFADASVGGLLARLEALPHLRELLVVWTSDHGEAFLEHGSQGHNATVYEEMVRVPLALRAFDGAIEPRVVAEAVSLLDLAPTLLELCGIEAPAEARGRSLAPLLDGRAASLGVRTLLSSSRYYDDRRRTQLAARRGPLKLVWTPAKSSWELFDLRADPTERVDVLGKHPGLARELGRILIERFHGQSPAPRGLPLAAPTPEELERDAALRELGYAQD